VQLENGEYEPIKPPAPTEETFTLKKNGITDSLDEPPKVVFRNKLGMNIFIIIQRVVVPNLFCYTTTCFVLVYLYTFKDETGFL
jgi:hypothetical protein